MCDSKHSLHEYQMFRKNPIKDQKALPLYGISGKTLGKIYLFW